MKFLCIACDAAMRLQSAAGPDDGALTVTFACPACGHRVAMLTNPWETQMVRTLGVKIGGRSGAAPPFEQVRATLAHQKDAAFVDAGGSAGAPASADAAAEGPGCPFAAMIPGPDAEGGTAPAGPAWTPEAAARVDRIPAFIRPMARQAIERYARDRGYGTITDAVMDEARTSMGM